MNITSLISPRMLLVYLLLAIFPTLSQAAASSAPAGAHVKSVVGSATLTTAGGKQEKIAQGTLIPSGSKIHTSEDSKVVIQWMPGALSVINSDTTVSVDSLNYSTPNGAPKRKIGLNLTHGSVFSHLNHNDGVSDFQIKTPAGVAAARGTDWSVAVDDNNVVTVSVATSAVDVTFKDGVVVTVQAGYGFVLDHSGQPLPLTPEQIALINQILALAGINVQMAVDQVYDSGDANTPIAITPLTSGQYQPSTTNNTP